MLNRVAVTAAVFGFLAFAVPHAQSKATHLGTWKLNVEKSKYSPGPAPKSQTRTFEDRGDGVFLINVEGIDANGNPTRQTMAFKYDSKEYPLATLNAAAITTVAQRRIDSHTVELTFKSGKGTLTAIETVSKDGKTMTFEQKGANAQGQQVHNVVILEKQ